MIDKKPLGANGPGLVSSLWPLKKMNEKHRNLRMYDEAI
jgi:hypothetical protein